MSVQIVPERLQIHSLPKRCCVSLCLCRHHVIRNRNIHRLIRPQIIRHLRRHLPPRHALRQHSPQRQHPRKRIIRLPALIYIPARRHRLPSRREVARPRISVWRRPARYLRRHGHSTSQPHIRRRRTQRQRTYRCCHPNRHHQLRRMCAVIHSYRHAPSLRPHRRAQPHRERPNCGCAPATAVIPAASEVTFTAAPSMFPEYPLCGLT